MQIIRYKLHQIFNVCFSVVEICFMRSLAIREISRLKKFFSGLIKNNEFLQFSLFHDLRRTWVNQCRKKIIFRFFNSFWRHNVLHQKNFHFFDFLGYIFVSRFLGSGSSATFCPEKKKYICFWCEFPGQESIQWSDVPIFWQRFFIFYIVLKKLLKLNFDFQSSRRIFEVIEKISGVRFWSSRWTKSDYRPNQVDRTADVIDFDTAVVTDNIPDVQITFHLSEMRHIF